MEKQVLQVKEKRWQLKSIDYVWFS